MTNIITYSQRYDSVGDTGITQNIEIVQLTVTTTSGSPRLTFTSGDGGFTILDIDFVPENEFRIYVPAPGLRASNLWISNMTNVKSCTIFYNNVE